MMREINVLRRWVILTALCGLVCGATACRSNGISVATVQNENDAIEILDLLRENNIEAEKVQAGEEAGRTWGIVVREPAFGGGDAVAKAIRVMQDNGLPRPADKGMERAYEGSGVVQSESAQKAQRLKEQKTEVERHLRALPGVIRVNVNIVPAEDITLRIDPFPASASVLLVLKHQSPDLTEAKVQNMVAGSVLGLKPERVTVTLMVQPPRPLSANQVNDAPAQLSSLVYALMGGGMTVLVTMLIVVLLQNRAGRVGASDEHLADGETIAPASPSNLAQSWLDDEADALREREEVTGDTTGAGALGTGAPKSPSDGLQRR